MLHSTTVLAYYIFDDHWTRSVLVKIYKNILGNLIPPYLFLNRLRPRLTIWQIYQTLKATAPRACSADLYDLSRNAYRNNDL